LLNLNDFQTLLTAAEAYFYLGYAVIPLLGDFDPNRPKVAARTWLAYQQRLATLDEINEWFSPTGGAAALGIVTGRISHLAVLDFDSADLFADFRHRYPDLLETRTVQSAGRGLPHLYFHVPAHLHLASQKRQGVDLLSDGRYVVAPPSRINGQAYRITRGGMPRLLTDHDIQRLQSFVSEQKASPSKPYIHVEPLHSLASAPLSTQWRGVGGEDIAPFPTPLPLLKQVDMASSSSALPSRANLHGLYHYWRTKYARNEALFRTALYARDHGWDQTQTRRALVTLHISQPGSNTSMETQTIRQREAYATIRSVFSRPARIPTLRRTQGREEVSLPNTVREALMQRKLTYVIRTLEGLLLVGFHPGKAFTADQAIQALKGIVGRDSVYNALNTRAPNGQPFFPLRVPSALPKASNEAAKQKQRLKTKKCFFVTEKKSGIKKKGIPARRFKLPHIKDLCRLLDVKSSGSDPLTRDDLMSAHQTRMALHRELIKRRPGAYSRRWLANRLGVSRRTINTYNQHIPIHTRPSYHETSLSWTSIDRMLSDEALAGAFIETLTGKKYPALRSIAAHLLAKGTYIRLKQRAANLYWYGSDDPPPNILPNNQEVEPKIQFEPQRRGDQKERLNHRDTEATEIKAEGDYESRPYPEPPPQPSPASKGGSNSVGTRYVVSDLLSEQPCRTIKPVVTPMPPAQQEALAQNIYTRINGLSLKNARKLVSAYSEKNIRFALNRLQQRTNLANPSGFFVSILRSTARMEEKV
jgi:Bifunctional DNA primase/polymerase, N-terminal